jgi:ricin-type beta-trefoil lectin protein/IgA peptidase M64
VPGAVGLYEGADYYRCKAYRPQYDCKMRTKASPYCTVCRYHLCDGMRGHLPWPTLVNRYSAQVMDLPGEIDDVNVVVQQNTFNPAGKRGGQRFRLEPLEDGYYAVFTFPSLHAFDIAGGSTAPGAKLQLYKWHGGPNQRFQIQQAGNGYVFFVAKHSGLALQVENASTTFGAKIVQMPFTGATEQMWRIFVKGAGLVAKHSGLSLQVEGGSLRSRKLIQQQPSQDIPSQHFRIEIADPGEGMPNFMDAGWYRIVCENSGMVLDVKGGSKDPFAPVQQYPWHNGDNQKFFVEHVGGGYFRLIAKHSGLALDIDHASPNAGAQLLQFPWSGANNQLWRL